MDTMFHLHDTIRATVDAQGLVKGALYRVVGVNANPVGLFGVVVTYDVLPANTAIENVGDRIRVANLHVLATLELRHDGPTIG